MCSTQFTLLLSFGALIFDIPQFRTTFTPGKRPTVLIHHRKLAHEYALKSQEHPGHASLAKFKELEKPDREEVCLNYLINAISFSLPPDQRDYVEDNFGSSVKETFRNTIDPFIESLSYKSIDGKHETPAQVCILKEGENSWALSPGHHEGVSILYKKLPNSEFYLFGLLEEMPCMEPRMTQSQLEMLYVAGQIPELYKNIIPARQNLGNQQSTRRFCNLNDYERFRLCAGGYLSFQHSRSEFPKYNEGNYISVGPPKCIKGNIVSDIKTEEELSVEADIVSCVINKDAELFFTNDPFSYDSMFLLEPQWRSASKTSLNEGVGTGFILTSHMSNVRALRPWVIE